MPAAETETSNWDKYKKCREEFWVKMNNGHDKQLNCWDCFTTPRPRQTGCTETCTYISTIQILLLAAASIMCNAHLITRAIVEITQMSNLKLHLGVSEAMTRVKCMQRCRYKFLKWSNPRHSKQHT